MTADLEQEIRRALHDRMEHVTPERLRHLDTPRTTTRRTGRSRWTMVGPIAAAACVALIAAAITLVMSGDDTKGSPAGGQSGSLNSLIGTSWRFTSVREGDRRTISIPQRVGASITFEHGGVFGASDSVNYYQATYTLLGTNRIRLAHAGGTAAGYGGDDSAVLAAINGLRAVLYTADGRMSPHSVSVRYSSGRLELRANGYTLVLGGEVPVATSSAPAPSSTVDRPAPR